MEIFYRNKKKEYAILSIYNYIEVTIRVKRGQFSPQSRRGTTRRLADLDVSMGVLRLHHGSDSGVLLFGGTGDSGLLIVFFFLLILGHSAPGRGRLLLCPDLLGRHLLLLLLLLGDVDGGLRLNFVLTAVVAPEGETGGATGPVVHFH